ncbi:MAG: GMP/IMP nucleotidase [Methylococcaceae bacterium]|nr:GMP/IMP nucleotidase [Methylococcaceae bacterium]
MTAWEDIDRVFLDMDGTLLDLNFDNHFWREFIPGRYAQIRGLSLTDAKRELEPRFQAMEGRIEWYCLDYWTAELGLDVAGLKQEVAGLIAVLPHVEDFLTLARQAGKRLVLVTNAHRKSLGLKMERTCLHAFFDAIVSSHDFGVPKENPEFWRRLRQTEAFDPASTLMVDDSLPVLRSAREFGIRHLVAVRKHDSTQPSRDITEFPAVENLLELIPAKPRGA